LSDWIFSTASGDFAARQIVVEDIETKVWAQTQQAVSQPTKRRRQVLRRMAPVTHLPSSKGLARTADVHLVSQKMAAGDFVVCPCKPPSGETHG
jgi:hypothetical protein